MNRKDLFSILIGVILLTSILATTSPVKPQNNTIVVDQDGSEDYTSIQSAINSAEHGDTIIVNDGVYYENVDIDKRNIELLGANDAVGNPIINGNRSGNTLIVNGSQTTIKRLRITGSGNNYDDAGIRVYSSNNTINNNIIVDNAYIGILTLSNSSDNTIKNNIIHRNNMDGINVGDNNIIKNNEITSNPQGITVSGNNNEITDNEIINSSWGIRSYINENNDIKRNLIKNSYEYGIRIWNGNNSIIKNNNIIQNEEGGIKLYEANENLIYQNNFIGNDINVNSTQSNNSWISPDPMNYTYNGQEHTNKLGNYYDDYSGSDEDGDGIGEIDYTIQNDNNDTYPLIDPIGNYTIQDQSETPGDLNGDGDVSATDLSLTIQLIINGEYNPAADINNDGNVSATDLSLIIQLIIQN